MGINEAMKKAAKWIPWTKDVKLSLPLDVKRINGIMHVRPYKYKNLTKKNQK